MPDRAAWHEAAAPPTPHFHFPQDFPKENPGLVPGVYLAVWYEADADLEWVEIVRDEFELTPGELTEMADRHLRTLGG